MIGPQIKIQNKFGSWEKSWCICINEIMSGPPNNIRVYPPKPNKMFSRPGEFFQEIELS